jgi:hypothetical protein
MLMLYVVMTGIAITPSFYLFILWFCWNGIPWTFCLGWPQTTNLIVSAFQVAKLIDMSFLACLINWILFFVLVCGTSMYVFLWWVLFYIFNCFYIYSYGIHCLGHLSPIPPYFQAELVLPPSILLKRKHKR